MPSASRQYPILRPGDPRFRALRPAGGECFTLVAFGPGDSTSRVLGEMSFEWGIPTSRKGGPVLLRSTYGTTTDDSMVYESASLRPLREALRVGDQRITLTYRGATVERTVQRGDSLEPRRVATFAHPVFGFNQRDLLLRVTHLRMGDTLIVPLYSEIDAALELDTISFVSAGPGTRVRVRFADPAIVATATVDTLTGRILDEEIRNRRRPGRMVRTLRTASGQCG